MDSVRDLKEIVEALIRSGHAEPGRIAVAGGSYGGFMVLASLTTYPDPEPKSLTSSAVLLSVFGVPSGSGCRSTPRNEKADCRIRPEGVGHG